mmetsp:Transcript_3681/g.5161  ORF Transcript_3681/g.5161 Transcript_3681/m.5161 type:complete len:144 (-) Transcript_3681:67-498(-)
MSTFAFLSAMYIYFSSTACIKVLRVRLPLSMGYFSSTACSKVLWVTRFPLGMAMFQFCLTFESLMQRKKRTLFHSSVYLTNLPFFSHFRMMRYLCILVRVQTCCQAAAHSVADDRRDRSPYLCCRENPPLLDRRFQGGKGGFR